MERNPKVTFNSKSEERKSHQLIEPVDTALDLIGNTP